MIICPVSAADDDLAAYLEQRGLKQLLATHLEQQLESSSGEARAELILRLAALYSELLETVADDAQRLALEQRSQQLLNQAPANSAAELRLALLRNSYRTAEKISENHRLRLTAPGEVDKAVRTFGDIVSQLNSLRAQLRQDVESANRKLTRAAGAESVAANEDAQLANRLYSQCTFLLAWSTYYNAWLLDRADLARGAEPLFAELMSAESSMPQPSDISEDLRSIEAVARSILGMALCKSLTASPATAVAWIELLEHADAYETLRQQAPVWKIAIHLEHTEFAKVRDVLDSQQNAGREIPLGWIRLVAVHALEAEGRSTQASELARMAVTQLASRGELQQVLDLANRYGMHSLGSSGFALRYVQGIIEYQQARQTHQTEEPAQDESVIGLYEKALQSLQQALTEPDAKQNPPAAAACHRLIAWCLYFQNRLDQARSAFMQASTALTGNEAAEALWMAIVCLDKLAEQDSRMWTGELNSLIERYLTLYPSSQHAPQLRLKRAVTATQPTQETVDDLLLIPPESEAYGMAQRRAAEFLYQLFRRGNQNDRQRYATQFLLVAVPLLGSAARQADLANPADAERFIVRCRQVLEVALADDIQRASTASIAFEAIEELRLANVDLSEHVDEFDCRRVQFHLLTDDHESAARVADDVWSRNSSSLWARLAVRSIFKWAFSQWKNAEADGSAQALQTLELVVRYGGRVLHEFRDTADALDGPGAIGYHAAVAEASMRLWEHAGDRERGQAALFLYEKLLEKRPNNVGYLRATALLAEHFERPERALECWRRMIAGSEAGSDRWFEAKVHLLELLLTTDPAHAREVIDQHKQLNPEFGPEPWGAQLRSLDERIPRAAAEEPESP